MNFGSPKKTKKSTRSKKKRRSKVPLANASLCTLNMRWKGRVQYLESIFAEDRSKGEGEGKGRSKKSKNNNNKKNPDSTDLPRERITKTVNDFGSVIDPPCIFAEDVNFKDSSRDGEGEGEGEGKKKKEPDLPLDSVMTSNGEGKSRSKKRKNNKKKKSPDPQGEGENSSPDHTDPPTVRFIPYPKSGPFIFAEDGSFLDPSMVEDGSFCNPSIPQVQSNGNGVGKPGFANDPHGRGEEQKQEEEEQKEESTGRGKEREREDGSFCNPSIPPMQSNGKQEDGSFCNPSIRSFCNTSLKKRNLLPYSEITGERVREREVKKMTNKKKKSPDPQGEGEGEGRSKSKKRKNKKKKSPEPSDPPSGQHIINCAPDPSIHTVLSNREREEKIRKLILARPSFKRFKDIDPALFWSESKDMTSYYPHSIPAPSELLSKLHNRFLYVLLVSGDRNDHIPNWYRIAPYQHPEEEDELPRPPPTKFYQRMGFGLVVCGSKIYSFGGSTIKPGSVSFDGMDDIWVYDTEAANPEWHKHPTCPRMPRIRSHPVALAVCHKIFVFGSNLFKTPKPSPWAEVFDTESGVWERVDIPAFLADNQCIDGFLVKGDNIFIEVGMYLYSYDVKTKVWKDIKKDYPAFVPLHRGGVILDDVCYVFKAGGWLGAYHMKHKTGTIVDVFGPLRTHYMWLFSGNGNVHRLGKDLLCAFSSVRYPPNQTFLICVVFAVSKLESEDDRELNISSTIISIQSYLVGGGPLEVSFAL